MAKRRGVSSNIHRMYVYNVPVQLHFYVPDDVGEALRRRAEQQGLSLSRYLATLVQADLPGGWPDGFFQEVVGGWQGDPLERAELGGYERRDPIVRLTDE